MNLIKRHSRVDGSVFVGSYMINRLLLADDFVLLASSEQVSTMPRQGLLKVSGNTLQQVEKFRTSWWYSRVTECGTRSQTLGPVLVWSQQNYQRLLTNMWHF